MFRFGYMTIRELEQKIFSKNFFLSAFSPWNPDKSLVLRDQKEKPYL